MRALGFIILLLFACSPQTEEDFYAEGSAFAEDLAGELRGVFTKKDLLLKESKIRKHYYRLAKLIGAASKVSDQMEMENFEVAPSSQELKKELERVYLIPGARMILEKIQQDAARELTSSIFPSNGKESIEKLNQREHK